MRPGLGRPWRAAAPVGGTGVAPNWPLGGRLGPQLRGWAAQSLGPVPSGVSGAGSQRSCSTAAERSDASRRRACAVGGGLWLSEAQKRP